MLNLLNIINGITKTLELTEKVLPLVTNYKKEIGNTINYFNKVINSNKGNIVKNNIKKATTKSVASSPTTLTFFQ